MTGKADRIQELVDDPDLKNAFNEVRETLRDMIEDTPVADDTALLDIRKMLYLLREVENSLHRAIEDGHLEDFRAREQEEIEQWQRNQTLN
jgi:hypothetical protein